MRLQRYGRVGDGNKAILEAMGSQRDHRKSGDTARTVHPDLDPDPFTKYDLSFIPTSEGAAHEPVVVNRIGGTIDLVVGTYTITTTVYTGTEGAFTVVGERNESGWR
jgi:hypothetical protein